MKAESRRQKAEISRRDFSKKILMAAPTIFIPRLIHAQSSLTADGLAAFKRKPAAGGGGGGDTPWVTAYTVGTTIQVSIPIGSEFHVGASSITVTKLGAYKLSGNTGTRVVEIRNLVSCTIIASATVDLSTVSAGQFASASITPITLSASTTYFIYVEQPGGQDAGNSNSTATTTSAASILAASFVSGSCQTTGGAGAMYAGANFWYH